MKKCFAGLLMLSIILCAFQAVVSAKEVSVIGYGMTQDEALADGLRLGVEQAVGTLVESETLVRNLVVVRDEIYSHSRGFVQEYTIVSMQNIGNQVAVAVKVNVDTEPNSTLMTQLQRLKLIQTGLRDPRIAVIIPEYHITRPIPDPAGETAVIRKLLGAGFTHIVDANQIQELRYENEVKAIMRGNTEEARSIASTLGVDYLIVGQGFSEYVGNLLNSGMLSCRARIEARLFNVDTGDIIATNGFHAGGVDITESAASKASLNNAGELMGDYMVQQLMTFSSNPEKNVHLLVRGVPNLDKVNVLDKDLHHITGVKQVYIRSYTDGLLTIDLAFSGTLKGLATALENLTDLSLDVLEMSNSAIQLRMKP